MVRQWLESNVVVVVVFSFCAVLAFAGESKDKDTNLRIDEFGITKSESIKNGFVFVNGRYLDAPYVLSRKGLGIFINDTMVRSATHWSPKKQPTGKQAPEKPDITKETSLYDKEVTQYIKAKTTYVQRHNNRNEVAKIMERVYRKLPNVKKAKIDEENPRTLHVVTYNGEKHPIGLVPPTRDDTMDEQEIMNHIESIRKHYVSRLRKGDCYFFSGNGAATASFAADKAGDTLPKLINILRSSKSQKRKFAELWEAGFEWVNKNTFASLVTNFQTSPQLEKRIQSITKKETGSSVD